MVFVNLELGNEFDFASLTEGDDTLVYENVPADQQTSLSESPGIDAIVGFAGNDNITDDETGRILFGNTGNDIINGAGGNDTIAAGQDSDIVLGGLGDDILFGNIGNDSIDAGEGNDLLFGGQDTDTLVGNVGDDTLSGDLSGDILRGGEGNDVLIGGDGGDVFVFGPGDGENVISDFEDGVDVIGFAGQVATTVNFESQDGNAVAVLPFNSTTTDDDVRVVFEGVAPSQINFEDFFFASRFN